MTPMSSALSLTLVNWSDAAAISLPKAMQLLGFPVFGLAAHHDDLGGELEFVPGVFHRGHQGEAHRKGLEFGVITDKGHFFLGPQRGDGHRDGAALHDAEIDGNGFRHVGQAEAHPVLGLDAHAF